MLDATEEIISAKMQMGKKKKRKKAECIENHNKCKCLMCPICILTGCLDYSVKWWDCVFCRRLVQTLPDKGKKIKEFVEKVRLAIEHHDEEEQRQSLVAAARTELQSKYRQAFTMQQRAVPTPAGLYQNKQSEAAVGDVMQERESLTASTDVQENNRLDEKQDQFVSRAAAGETMETAAAGASLNSKGTKEGDLVEALERVRVSETSIGFSSESKDPLNSRGKDNYFFRKQEPKKPHYVTVLEKTEKTPSPRRQKFKPNQ